MPIVRPKNYPIRKIDDDKQQVGQIYNPPRMLRGYKNMEYPKDSTFMVEAPEKGSKPADEGGKAPY